MPTTLAEMNDRVCLEVPPLAEFVEPDRIHNAVVQSHNIRVAFSRLSTQNVLLSQTAAFTPTGTTYDITSLIGKGEPSRVEYLDGDGVTWRLMRVVPAALLDQYIERSAPAVAFSSVEGDTGTEPVEYILFSFLPPSQIRISYAQDTTRKSLADNILLPDHVAELIVKEAQQTLIPAARMAITMRCRNDKDLREIANDLKADLTLTYEQNQTEIQKLLQLWKVWAFRDRSADDPINSPTPVGSTLYGD